MERNNEHFLEFAWQPWQLIGGFNFRFLWFDQVSSTSFSCRIGILLYESLLPFEWWILFFWTEGTLNFAAVCSDTLCFIARMTWNWKRFETSHLFKGKTHFKHILFSSLFHTFFTLNVIKTPKIDKFKDSFKLIV